MESSPLQVAAGGLPVGSRSDTGPTWDQSANGSELAQLRRAAVCLLPSPGLALQQQRREDANLMLLTLLTATTSTTFFASAVIAARHAKAGLSGYVLAIIIGLLLAICNAWTLYKVGGHSC